MTNRGVRLIAATIVALACAGFAAAASAQLTSQDKTCISAFNKGVRTVAKAQAGIVRKCLSDFAAGRLTLTTPEDCVRTDPSGDLNRTVVKTASKVADKCAAGMPSFGVSQIETALARAALSQIDLAHASFGNDLDTGLIPSATDAACQSSVGAVVLKCADRRLREFLKCQKNGLKNGSVTDAASLAAACLGTGGSGQPDPKGKIALDCSVKVGNAMAQKCTGVSLPPAFAPCDSNDPTAARDCLKHKSACETCLLLNDVDGIARDCDMLDDGDGGNGSCGRECADGVVQSGEGCDDGNTNDNDGCSSSCTVEGGYSCAGQPSVCVPKCGNGALDAGELCDDGDMQSGDGCSSSCLVESGYSCTGQPSVCTHTCGNGVLDAGEACDDHNEVNGDGCSSTCQVEGGFNCAGQPSVCSFVCGNGTFQTGETCDDGNAGGGDGCSNICTIEPGWLCFGAPSTCMPLCGDGLLRGGELCDDGNILSGDGCSFQCQTEPGFQCTGQPSHCLAVCGDGFIRGFENCDDGNTNSGDGCSGNFCRVEAGFGCAGQPSVCSSNCGNGHLDGTEQCDDGAHVNGDGCHSDCVVETGYVCSGQPSTCQPTCGNGMLDSGEACDDGNTVSRDGCSAACKGESGWICNTPGQACQKFEIFIDTPANGVFTTAGTVNITGHYTLLTAGQASVTINGVPPNTIDTTNRTFSHTLSLDQVAVFNPVRATLTNTANNDKVHDRIVVIAGNSVADGSFSPQSVALRLNDSGLDSLEPLVTTLASGQFDLGTLVPAGTVLIDQCFISVIGCWGSAQVVIANPPPSFSTFSLAIDSQIDSVFGDIRINDIRVDVDINGSGLVPSCGLRLTANQLQLTGSYSLEPLVGDPSNIDVNLISPMGINFSGFNHTFTSGLCDAPIIGDIIEALLPDLQSAVTNGIAGFLNDPDGAGPQDSPIAAGIQSALAGISITGPVGAGIGLMLETPLFTVAEDNVGITFGSDSRFRQVFGTGPGQCIPPPGAPDLTASYSKPEVFPSFGATAPVSHAPYGLGIALSTAAFNQLLRGQTECGLMRASLSSVDLDGSGGQPPLPVTSSLLSLIIPEFAQLPANTPLRIDIAPTLAPIITGNNGPGGSLTELKIAQVTMNVVEPGPETVWLSGAIDARLGMNLAFNGSGLSITLTPPQTGDITIAIMDNPLGASEAQVETALPALMTPLIPQLAGALSGFPLPEFLGLQLQGVEVSRNGQFLSLFANLAPVP